MVIRERETLAGSNGIDKEQKNIYKRGLEDGKGGRKISLDKMENVDIINNALILLFEN